MLSDEQKIEQCFECCMIRNEGIYVLRFLHFSLLLPSNRCTKNEMKCSIITLIDQLLAKEMVLSSFISNTLPHLTVQVFVALFATFLFYFITNLPYTFLIYFKILAICFALILKICRQFFALNQNIWQRIHDQSNSRISFCFRNTKFSLHLYLVSEIAKKKHRAQCKRQVPVGSGIFLVNKFGLLVHKYYSQSVKTTNLGSRAEISSKRRSCSQADQLLYS